MNKRKDYYLFKREDGRGKDYFPESFQIEYKKDTSLQTLLNEILLYSPAGKDTIDFIKVVGNTISFFSQFYLEDKQSEDRSYCYKDRKANLVDIPLFRKEDFGDLKACKKLLAVYEYKIVPFKTEDTPLLEKEKKE